MALTEKSRSALYVGLTAVIDDQEAVSDMLAQFPARDIDELVTKDHLRAEMADLRVEMAEGFARVSTEVSSEMRKWFLATVALMLALAGAVAAVARSVGG